MIDYALRRRFSFFDMESGFDSEGFINYQNSFANETFNTLIERIKELNKEIAQDKSLGKGFCIGHSYFCNANDCTEEWMKDVVDFDILPMLSEYWFDESSKLQRWENILHGVFQFIKNIYYMLSYAFQTLNQENYEDVAVESFDEMYDLLAAILARGIGIQLKQGLYREYINRQEELTVMRGKINMPETIKNRLVRKQLLTCDYDELSENNLFNQIIKTTVMMLLRNAKVKAEYKDDLKKKMLFFSDVDTLEPTSIRWSSIRFQRNNQTYRMLISLSAKLYRRQVLTMTAKWKFIS